MNKLLLFVILLCIWMHVGCSRIHVANELSLEPPYMQGPPEAEEAEVGIVIDVIQF